jgi:hypothetical protein
MYHPSSQNTYTHLTSSDNYYLLSAIIVHMMTMCPAEARLGPEGSKRVRLPDFKTIST